MKLYEALKKANTLNSVLALDGQEFVYIGKKYPLVYRNDATLMLDPTPEQLLSDKWKIKHRINDFSMEINKTLISKNECEKAN